MTRPTLVITGASGFVGIHLAELATKAGYDVCAIGREPDAAPALATWCDEYVGADLTLQWPIARPVDAVIHLAGLADVGRSFAEPQRYLTENSAMVTNMCEAMLAAGSRARIVVVSSGAVYQPSADGAAIDEDAPTAPTSPYAVAKLLVETQSAYYRRRGLATVVARPFNHIGPGQGRGFLIPDLAAQFAATPEGSPLVVGNVDTERDYTDVRDVARAYLAIAAAETHRHDVYNVASGASHSGREVLHAIADALGRPVPALHVDEARLRPGDPPRITGSAARLRDEFGWAPQIPWTTSIADFVAAAAA